MCRSGAIFEDEASHIDEKEKELKGWGFDVDVLRESEGGAFSSLDRRSPRADFTNVHPTKQGDNLPNGMSPNGNRCEYSGLRSTSSYM